MGPASTSLGLALGPGDGLGRACGLPGATASSAASATTATAAARIILRPL
jgi:hypothetical protein